MKSRVEEKSNRDLVLQSGGLITGSTAPGSAFDVQSFIHEYYDAWSETDEERILSYYADNVVLQIPGVFIEGKEFLRDQFVRPFITAFPGNCHRVKNMICGRGVVNVEFSFEAQHTGPFAGHAATGARVVVPGCGVYEYDSDKRQITAARIYFDVGTLLQSITDFSQTDRNKAAVALHLSERNLSLIINTIPTFAWSARPDGYGDFLNQRWLDYTGMTAEQATGWGWGEAIHPDDRKGLVGYWQSCLASGVAGEIEARMRRFDGAYRWFLFRASPLRDESGNIVKWYGANIDIDDRKRGEEALRASELSWRQIVDSIPGLVATMTPMGGVEFLNRQTLDYFGKTSEELKDWALIDAVHPADLPRVIETWTTSIEKGEAYQIEHRCRRADGIYRWFQVRGLPVRSAEGKIIAWYLLLTDIDDLKKAEEAVRSSQRDLSLTIDTIPTFISVSLPDGTVLSVNQAALDYHGVTLQDVQRGEHRTRFFHPDDVERVREVRKEGLKHPRPFEYEQRAMGKDGKYRWFSVRHNPLLDDQGRIERWYAIAFDIEDRKRAEEALQARELDARSLLDNMPGFLGRHSPDGTPEIVNRPFLQYHGKTVEEIGQWRTSDVVHHDDLAHVIEGLASGISGGQPWGLEFRLRRFDGIYRWFQARWVPVRDGEGRILHWNALTTDIDDRKRAEDALARHAGVRGDVSAAFSRPTHLREILRGCAEAIVCHLDAAFARIWMLNKDESMLELQASAGVYTRLDGSYSRIPVGDLKVGLIAREKKAHFTNDVVNDPRVNDKRWAQSNGMVAFAGYPLVVEDRLIGVVALFARHTLAESVLDTLASVADTIAQGIERKRAEEELRASEAFLAEGQRLSHTGSWGWNASTGKLVWSEEHFRILGLDPQDTNPSLDVFWERVHPDDRIGLRSTFEAAVRDKKDFDQQFRIVTPDWSIRHLHGVGRAILSETSELVEFVGSTMDITERKRAEERAQSQNEAVRMALNAFVEALDVNRFLGNVITGLTKQFQAPFSDLWLFDDSTGAPSLYLSCQQGKVVTSEAKRTSVVPEQDRSVTWRPSNVGRNPRIIELPVQATSLEPEHLELLTGQGVKTLMIVPLVLGEQTLGVFELHFQAVARFTPDDLDLAQALVHHATLALQLNRLAHRTEQMAVTEERNRLAREIHDTLAQAFAGIVLHTEALGAALGVSKVRSKKALGRIQTLARSGLDEARRSVQALRPKALEGSTLPEALKQAAQRFSANGKLACNFKQQGKVSRMPADVQNELFRIAQEAMTNVAKHAQAKSLWINLAFKPRQVILIVRDDGIGIAATDSSKPKRGYGLATMRERAQGIGGRLEIENGENGGTSVRVSVPLTQNLKPKTQSV